MGSKMKDRKPLKLSDTIKESIIKMSEGNPGAISVLAQLIPKYPLVFLGLDDMNIRGWQIWVGYKDFCKCDIVCFIQRIKERSEEMIFVINQEAVRSGYDVRAVKGGASNPKT